MFDGPAANRTVGALAKVGVGQDALEGRSQIWNVERHLPVDLFERLDKRVLGNERVDPAKPQVVDGRNMLT